MGNAINTTGKSKRDGGKKGKAEGKPSFNKKAGWKGTKKGAAETKPVETTTNFVHQTIRPVGCFICNGPHRAKDYPKREKLSALVTADDKASTECFVVAQCNQWRELTVENLDACLGAAQWNLGKGDGRQWCHAQFHCNQ